jgi:anti-sigma28 factor (negative regulator of flagellin synthesis)
MRVNGPTTSVVERPTSESTEGTSASSSAETGAARRSEPSVVVQSSGASTASAAAERRSSEQASRLAQLASDLRNGTYEPNLEKLADRLVEDELERGR